MIVPIIGPSKAGKTETTRAFVESSSALRFRHCDLDDELGQQDRGNGQKATELIQALLTSQAPGHAIVDLVDIGAGQLVSQEVSAYLRAFPEYPASVLVIWCDEQSFRIRHGVNWPNEVDRYYGYAPLTAFWQAAAAAGRLVDTSGQYAPKQWAERLGAIVNEVVEQNEGIPR